jgi:hypothetical protein
LVLDASAAIGVVTGLATALRKEARRQGIALL